jgi:hypothetical protein
MDLGVNGKCRLVDGVVTVEDLALVIYKDEVRDADQAKIHPDGIKPKAICVLRVPDGDVSGDALAETQFSEKPKCCSKSFLSVLTFVLEIVEDGDVVGDWLARCTNHAEIVRIETCGHRSSPFVWGAQPVAMGRSYVRIGIR